MFIACNPWLWYMSAAVFFGFNPEPRMQTTAEHAGEITPTPPKQFFPLNRCQVTFSPS